MNKEHTKKTGRVLSATQSTDNPGLNYLRLEGEPVFLYYYDPRYFTVRAGDMVEMTVVDHVILGLSKWVEETTKFPVVEYLAPSVDIPGTTFISIQEGEDSFIDGHTLVEGLRIGDVVRYEAHPIIVPKYPDSERVLFTSIEVIRRNQTWE
jgi:hypothetical protein